MEFEFAFQMQYTSFKLNVPQISTLHIMEQLYHVLVHLLPKLSPLVDDCAGNSASETVITPKEEDHR